MNHRSNPALGQRAQPAESWQLLMIIFPDLNRIAAGDQIGQLAAAESSFKASCPGKQDSHGLLSRVVDWLRVRSLAVIAPAASVRQRLGIAEIVHDRLLPAARSIRIAAN